MTLEERAEDFATELTVQFPHVDAVAHFNVAKNLFFAAMSEAMNRGVQRGGEIAVQTIEEFTNG